MVRLKTKNNKEEFQNYLALLKQHPKDKDSIKTLDSRNSFTPANDYRNASQRSSTINAQTSVKGRIEGEEGDYTSYK